MHRVFYFGLGFFSPQAEEFVISLESNLDASFVNVAVEEDVLKANLLE